MDILSKCNFFLNITKTGSKIYLSYNKNELESFLDNKISDDVYNLWLDKNLDIYNYFNMYYFSYKIINSNKYLLSMRSIYSYILSKNSKTVVEDFDTLTDKILQVNKSIFVKGVGNIPDLFLTLIENQNTGKNINKFLLKYPFLFEYLYKNGYNESIIFKFIEDNQSKLNNLVSLFSSNPKMLGAGADGMAFDIGNNMVLKLFEDKYLYDKSIESLNRLHKDPTIGNTEAMIYDVGVLGSIKDPEELTIYYYVMEKMQPLSSLAESALQYIVAAIVSKIRNDFPSELKEIKNKIKDNNKDIENDLDLITRKIKLLLDTNSNVDSFLKKIEKEYTTLAKDWFFKLIKEVISKYLTSRTDLHMGNIGFSEREVSFSKEDNKFVNEKSGYFRYFDPAYKRWQSDINI